MVVPPSKATRWAMSFWPWQIAWQPSFEKCQCATQADTATPDLASVALSAGIAGTVLSSVLSPFELVKVCHVLRHAASSAAMPAFLLLVLGWTCLSVGHKWGCSFFPAVPHADGAQKCARRSQTAIQQRHHLLAASATYRGATGADAGGGCYGGTRDAWERHFLHGL